MYYFGYQRVHKIGIGYFFTVPILLVALHLLEGAGPPEADGYTIFILLVGQVRRRARLAALRGGEHRLAVRCWRRRLAARWPWVGGAAAGVLRLWFFVGSVESVTRFALRCEAAKPKRLF